MYSTKHRLSRSKDLHVLDAHGPRFSLGLPRRFLLHPGSCIEAMRSLAQVEPGAVLAAVAETQLLHIESPWRAGATAGGVDPLEASLPSLENVQLIAEGPTGKYPVTIEFLGLVADLLEAGFSDANLQVIA